MGIKVFLAGDVMTGRGIDQILPYPSPSKIYESYVGDARGYLELAERTNGKINYPVSFDYIWGDALGELEKARPDVRIINLETTVTTSEDYLAKGINYRMNPKNIPVLKALGADVCVLANNHILDWGQEGLIETIEVLGKNGIKTAGAGRNYKEAREPAVFDLKEGRVIVFSFGHYSSGTGVELEAKENKPGANILTDLSEKAVREIEKDIARVRKEGDIVIFSVHWGPNWGYRTDEEFDEFAHGLIDTGAVEIVFGHSSHHFKGLEIYKDKLIIYGAGDFINDYEGIRGYENFRGDLCVMYLPEIDSVTKKTVSLTIVPMQIKRFRLNYPRKEDVEWCYRVLQRDSVAEGGLIQRERKIIWGLEN